MRDYTSPFFLLCALILIEIFSRTALNNTSKKIIAKLSPLTLGLYLFQTNHLVLNDVIGSNFSFVVQYNYIFGVCIVIASGILICFIGFVVEYLRNEMFKILKINMLIGKISILINGAIENIQNK